MYNFKVVPEVAWSAAVAAVAFLAQAMFAANFPDVASDPRAWGVTVVAGMARAALAVFMSRIGKTEDVS